MSSDPPESPATEQAAASASRAFFKHARNYLSANLVGNLVVALSFPLLTYLLSTEDYGVLSIFTSLVSLLTILFLLNINSGVTRYYLEKHDDFDRALGTNLVFIGAFNVVLLIPLLLFADTLAGFFELPPEVLVYAIIAAALSVLPQFYLVYLATAQHSRRFALLSVIRTVLGFALMVVIILLLEEHKYLGKVYAEVAVLAAFSVYAFYHLHKLAKYQFASRYIKYTLRFSLPLIPHSMSRYILGYFDRIQINQITNASEAGIYAFAYDVGMIMSLIVIAAGRAWRPIFIEEYGDGNIEKLNLMVRSYANQIYLAAAAIMLFATDIVTLFIEERFHPALPLVPIVVLGYVFVFVYTLYFQYASYRKRTELISIATLLAGGTNIALNYWLIPIYGYQAAAYTTLASFALLFALHYGNARFILREQVLKLRNLTPGFLVVAGISAAVIYLETVIASYPVYFAVRVAIMGAVAYLFFWRPRQQQRA